MTSIEFEPLVTVGIPVFNGAPGIERAVRSVLAQTYQNIEMLVLDNASTDDTGRICRALAEEDRRVRYICNDSNIGQNPNFRRVFELSSGSLFRWMGADDWLEPTCIEASVERMVAMPTAVLVSTYQQHVAADGRVLAAEHTGRRPDQPSAVSRLRAMLFLLRGSSLWIDPVYSLMRSESLGRTDLIRPERFGDQILACEVSLLGPFAHVPAVLSNRGYEALPRGRAAHRQYSGGSDKGWRDRLDGNTQRVQMTATLCRLIWTKPDLAWWERLAGGASVVEHYFRIRLNSVIRRLRRLAGKPPLFEY